MTHSPALDPQSPVPRYHQIAELIRAQITEGELGNGDVLTPLRRAAQDWGVNLHTVRHAYAELARQGLVENRRAVGTRVVAQPGDLPRPARRPAAPAPSAESRSGFLHRVAREAFEQYGMSAQRLADALTTLAGSQPGTGADGSVVYVVECSQTQCEDLARQVEAGWDVAAQPWCLHRDGEPPAGAILATYFHYNEIRRRWPRRLAGVHFASIAVDPRLGRLVTEQARWSGSRRAGRPVVTLHEFDQPTLDAVRADLSVALPASRYELQTRLIGTAAEALATGDDSVPLVTPRVWGELSQVQRATGPAIEVRYVFAGGELDPIGHELNWRHRTPTRRGNTAHEPDRPDR